MTELYPAGTGALVRLILRRDRFVLPVWILVTAGLAWASASSFAQLYPTPESRQTYVAEVASNPAVIALLGPVLAPSVGGLVAWRWTIQGIFFAALGSLLIVIRHTRADEEAGRRELVQSTPVARHAPLTAALLVTIAGNLLIALFVAGGLIASYPGLSAAGSLALGLSVAAVGCVAAATAGVTAQLTQTAGAARGVAGSVVGACYLLRLAGDVSGAAGGSGWAAWLSPVGWARFTRPFAGEQWWVFGLFLALVAGLAAVALALAARRDLGAGLLPESVGAPAAGPLLGGPFGLAWRLHRGALVAWVGTFAIIGVAFGYVVKTVADLLSGDPTVADFLASLSSSSSVSDAVFHLYFLTFGPLIALYAIRAALVARSQEVDARAEPVLAAAVSRTRWMSSHLLVAALGPVAILGVLGLTAGLTYGSSVGDISHQVPRVVAAALAYLPAVWVMAGVAAAQYGLLPRLSFLSWGAWLVFAMIDFAHERQLVSQSVYDISPFAHVPKILLGEPLAVGPLVVLLGVAAVLMMAGLAGFARRDVG